MDLPALQAYLAGLPRPIALRADDANLPRELRDFLATTPSTGLTVAATGGGTLAGKTLTLDGASTDTWPVAGLDGVTVALATARLVLTDGATPMVSGAATGTATLPVSSATVTVPVALASGTATAGVPVDAWRMTTTAALTGAAPFDLLMVGKAGEPPFPVPPDLDALTKAATVPAGDMAVTFQPAGDAEPVVLTVDLSLPSVRWTLVPSMLELDGVDVGITTTATSFSVALTGHVTVGGVGLDVTLGMSPSPEWTVRIAPTGGGAFPGISALAAWAGGSGDAASTAFGDVGFDVAHFDAALSTVVVAFDWQRKALSRVDVGSVLTLGTLTLDAGLRLPDLSLTGSMHDDTPVAVTGVLPALGLPTDGVPKEMSIEAVAFEARPAQGTYFVSLEVAEPWPAGPVDIEDVTVAVTYDAGDFSGFVHGTVALGTSITMRLEAEYAAGGWTFAGRTMPGSVLVIGDLLDGLATSFGVHDVPAPLSELELTDVAVTYTTATGAFAFTCTGTLPDLAVAVTLTVALDKAQAGTYTARFSGTATVAGMELDLVLDVSGSGATVAATHTAAPDAKPVALRDLVASVSEDAATAVPGDLVIGLTEVALVWVKRTGVFVLALELGASVSLSDLPLVGGRLPPGETVAVERLRLLYASGAVDAAAVKTALPTTLAPLPDLAAGVAVTAILRIGDTPRPLSLGVAATPRQGPTTPRATSPATTSAPSGHWVDVQKQVGAVHLERVGVLYQSNALLFAVDAALTVGPVTVSVDGLGFGSPLTSFEPVFSVTGLGVAYDAPPVTIEGALLNVPAARLPRGVSFQFDGTAVVHTGDLSLAAVGSYAETAGGPSLFLFVQAEAPLGGPPAFFVTGLMGGFGVNRSLTLPAQDEVAAFPLLALNAPRQDPMHVLDVLEGREPAVTNGTAKAWIAPAPGRYWLALGVEFTSFELVRSRALLVAERGEELVLALVGLSTIRLPQAAESAETYAYAELELDAVLKPGEGVFGLTAVLGPASYVVAPACHLTGGFAFSVWFGDSAYAGQFVVTLGGYHPAFRPPPYFPSVPRLGFSWAVSGTVSISGNAYLAVTTTCAMAGGSLDVRFQDGNLRAWFTARLDVLVSWRPFSFDAYVAVGIGVSYRMSALFCHKTVSASLGADVHLWGPPTGGTVHVRLWCVSFTVAFGSGGGGAARDPLSWEDFKGLLPAPASVVTVVPVSGLYKNGTSAVSTNGALWVVRARDLRFATQSAMPVSHLRYGDGGSDFTTEPIDVRPMNLTGVTSEHRLTVTSGSPSGPPLDVSGWVLTPRTQNLPESLWGAPPVPFSQTPAAPGAAVLPGRQVGYDVQAARPVAGATPGLVALTELMAEYLPPGTLPIAPGTPASTAYVPVADATSVGLVAGVANAAAARASLLAALSGALGYAGTAGELTALAANAGHLFADPPMRQP
ncbi:MAG TPA: DUF6603 domain-containing protein [Frankiaceae bacterium]|nr:DUF6603 domain-containing protein [Frankiaceae bacterium]